MAVLDEFLAGPAQPVEDSASIARRLEEEAESPSSCLRTAASSEASAAAGERQCITTPPLG